ncbi:MAG: lysylphosphatidylglycerol synthase transmembrane domain-containing protein [Candidatus Binatia bacterium]
MDARVWRTLIVAMAVSGAFLYLAFRDVPLGELLAAIRRADPAWLALAVVVSLLIMIMRTWRWQLELRPLERVPFRRLWTITAVAYLAINLLPVRLGEVVRPWLLARRSSVSFANVVGILVVEKTMDALVTLFYILAGLSTIETLPAWVRTGAKFPAALAAALVTLSVLLYWRGEAFVDGWLLHRLPARLGTAVRRVTGAIVAGMRVLPDARLLLAVFLVSLALWFLPILSSYIVIRAFGLDVPFSAAVVVFIFIGFGTALPNVPGMIGPFQYACILALGLFGVDRVDALAYGLVLNAIQFLTLLAQGLIALPLVGVRFADLKRAGREAGSPALGGTD